MNVLSTEQTVWKLHESYRSAEQALNMASFFKDQVGYKGVKVVHVADAYHIFVLVNR